MNEELNGRKRPTTDQRRAMAKLAEDIFARRIEEAKGEERSLMDELTGDLRKELGIDDIERQIELLEKKKDTLGWRYSGFTESSRAGRLLKGRVAKRGSSVRDLEKRRKEALADIWTCESVDELNEMVNDL